jgi:hypothetical protein
MGCWVIRLSKPVGLCVCMWCLPCSYSRWARSIRLQYEREATRGEPGGWQRWRRQLLEQTWDKIIVFAQGYYGIFHLAEYSLLLGVRLKDEPPGVGTLQQVLAKYGLPARG